MALIVGSEAPADSWRGGSVPVDWVITQTAAAATISRSSAEGSGQNTVYRLGNVAITVVLVVLVVAVASWRPVRRALDVDPAMALKTD